MAEEDSVTEDVEMDVVSVDVDSVLITMVEATVTTEIMAEDKTFNEAAEIEDFNKAVDNLSTIVHLLLKIFIFNHRVVDEAPAITTEISNSNNSNSSNMPRCITSITWGPAKIMRIMKCIIKSPKNITKNNNPQGSQQK